MTAKRHSKQNGHNLFLEISILPYYRLSVILASKQLKKDIKKNVGLFIFDIFCSAFWFAVLIMMGKAKFFNMGDFRFIWGANLLIVGILGIAFLIGFLRRKYSKHDEDEEEKPQKVKFSKEEFTESVRHNPHVIKKKVTEFKEQGDFKDRPELPHYDEDTLAQLLRDNPELSVKEK